MPPARQTWTPLNATSSWSGSKSAAVVPIGGEHPAPVGVAAEDRALEQVAPGDRSADLDRVGLGRRVLHVDGDVVRGALGVGEQLQGQIAADLGQRGLRTRPASGAIPEAPLLIRITVSLVDMQPSLSTRSKLSRQASAS